MNKGTTSETAAHMTGVSRRKRAATSGNKRIVKGGSKMSAASQTPRAMIAKSIKGPGY